MTNIADTLLKIDTIASQRGLHDELTSLIIHALKQLNGGARITMKASPLGSATPEMNGKRRLELVDQISQVRLPLMRPDDRRAR